MCFCNVLNLSILPHTNPTGSIWRQLVFRSFNMTLSRPRRVYEIDYILTSYMQPGWAIAAIILCALFNLYPAPKRQTSAKPCGVLRRSGATRSLSLLVPLKEGQIKRNLKTKQKKKGESPNAHVTPPGEDPQPVFLYGGLTPLIPFYLSQPLRAPPPPRLPRPRPPLILHPEAG